MTRQVYQPIIDGLRAVAVIAVILNHLDKQWCPGGYLGVDVFFVISGFVVTSSFARRSQVSTGHGALLLGFYARRVNRLLPNLILCTLISGVAICLMSPEPRVSLRTGVAALFGVSNLYLQHAALDYFVPAAGANAYTQTWSLGVEEQFYLGLPLLWLASTARWRGIRGNWTLLIGLAAAMSLCWDLYQAEQAQTLAYFALSTRIWELAAGCLLALKSADVATATGYIKRFITPAIVLLACSFALAPLLPAVLAKLTTVGCVLVLIQAAAMPKENQAPAALLGHRAVVQIGRLSYSLYLWHWPVICLVRWGGLRGVEAAALDLALFIPIATAAYLGVEKPLRQMGEGRPDTDRLRLGWTCAVVGALALNVLDHVSGHLYLFAAGGITQHGGSVPVDTPHPYFGPRCEVLGKRALPAPAKDFAARCTVPPTTGRRQMLWMLGDSHAGHYQGLLTRLHAESGLGTYLVTVLGVPFPAPPGGQELAGNALFADIAQRWQPGDIVILSRLYLTREDNGHSVRPGVDNWLLQVAALADQLEHEGVRLLVIGPTPMFEFINTDLCVIKGPNSDFCSVERKGIARPISRIYRDLAAAARAHPNLKAFDPWHLVCPDSSALCSPWIAGQLGFHDREHLSSWGAESMEPAFRARLVELGWMAPAQPEHAGAP